MTSKIIRKYPIGVESEEKLCTRFRNCNTIQHLVSLELFIWWIKLTNLPLSSTVARTWTLVIDLVTSSPAQTEEHAHLHTHAVCHAHFFNQHWYRFVLLFIDFFYCVQWLASIARCFALENVRRGCKPHKRPKFVIFISKNDRIVLEYSQEFFLFYLWVSSCLFVPIANGTSLLAFSYSTRSRPS